MKLFYLLLLASIFCLTACDPKSGSNDSKWILFANDKNDKLYYTLDKMDKTDSGVIKIWVKTVFGKKMQFDEKEAAYAKNMFMINCSANSYKMNVGFFFSDKNEIVSKTASTQPDVMPQLLDRSSREFTFKPISTAREEYFPIMPNSPAAALKVIACQK
jgi:hypothetical protein